MRITFFLTATFIIFTLTACNTTQAPAPITHYGASEGEGSGGVHIVNAGDTLYSVSKRYKIVMRDIVYMNDLTAPFALSISQRLKLPPPHDYRVRQGDSLYAIARIFDVSQSEIARMNNMHAPYVLTAGETITLPSVHPAVAISHVNIETAQSGKAIPAPPVHQGQTLAPPTQNQRYASNVPQPNAKPKIKARITTKTPKRTSSKFLRPVNGEVVSKYGPKKGGLHNDGVNIAAARGAPVKAAENGVVVYVGNELKGSGNLVLLRHSEGWMSAYAHLDKMTVTRGQVINRGSLLGTVGSTGNVDKPQLHFEVRRGTQAINPERYL